MYKFLFVLTQAIEAGSSANISNSSIINSLIELGHDVDILCPYSSNTNETLIRKEAKIYRIGDVLSNNREQVNKSSKIKRIIRSIIKKTYYLFNVFDHTIRIAKRVDISVLTNKKYDFVVSLSDPKTSHLAVMELIKQGLVYNKWVQYWGDPLTIDITRLSKLPKFILKKKERKILAMADKIIYVSPFTCDRQKMIFKNEAERMFFLPPPYFKEEIEENHKNNPNIRVGYFGAYESFVRNIMPVYNTFLNGNMVDYELLIVGNSNLVLESKNNIKIFSRVSYKEVEKMQAECDVLFCITNLNGTQIPAKIYYSAATYKPIVIAVDGEMAAEMKEYFASFNRFIVCDNDINSITIALEKAKSMIGKCSPCRELSSKSVTESFLNIMLKE